MEDLEKLRREYELESLKQRRELENLRHEADLERIQQESELRRARQKMELEKIRNGDRSYSDRTSDAILAGMFTVIFGVLGFSFITFLDVLFTKFFQSSQLLDTFLPIYLFVVVIVAVVSAIRAWRR